MHCWSENCFMIFLWNEHIIWSLAKDTPVTYSTLLPFLDYSWQFYNFQSHCQYSFCSLYVQNVFLTIVNPIYQRFAFFTSLTSFLVLKVLACNLYSTLHNHQHFFFWICFFSKCALYFHNKKGLFCSSVTHSHFYPQSFGLVRVGNFL